jgi:hypothetical protein
VTTGHPASTQAAKPPIIGVKLEKPHSTIRVEFGLPAWEQANRDINRSRDAAHGTGVFITHIQKDRRSLIEGLL